MKRVVMPVRWQCAKSFVSHSSETGNVVHVDQGIVGT